MSRDEFDEAFAAAEAEAVPLTIAELNAGKGKAEMTTREEAAAKAIKVADDATFDYPESSPTLTDLGAMDLAQAALAAADAHDAENGVRRIAIDDGALFGVIYEATDKRDWAVSDVVHAVKAILGAAATHQCPPCLDDATVERAAEALRKHVLNSSSPVIPWLDLDEGYKEGYRNRVRTVLSAAVKEDQ